MNPHSSTNHRPKPGKLRRAIWKHRDKHDKAYADDPKKYGRRQAAKHLAFAGFHAGATAINPNGVSGHFNIAATGANLGAAASMMYRTHSKNPKYRKFIDKQDKDSVKAKYTKRMKKFGVREDLIEALVERLLAA